MFPAFSRVWAINLLLAAFVVAFGVMTFDVWSKADEAIPELPAAKSPEKALPEKRIAERTVPPDSTFAIVAEKNLFAANRSEVIPEAEKEKQKKEGPLKISEKLIYLYGVIVMGNHKKALISNPDPAPAPGKAKSAAKDKWVAIGDTIGTFNVTDIRKDRIILTDGANKHEILLYDKNKPARQVTVVERPSAPTVVATGAGGAASPAQAPAKTEQATASGAADKAAPAAGEYRVVNTPFGPAKRRIQ